MSTKNLSLAIVMLAFLAGAFVTVLDPVNVNWSWLVPILLIGATALWKYRKLLHGEASASHKLSGNMETLEKCLANVLANLEELCARKKDLPVYEARFEIDRLFREDLNDFAESRETMIHVFGMQNYADVMSAFAAGERYINRVWSASTDGYEEEVSSYLEKARNQFVEANGLFTQFKSAVPNGSAAATA